MAKRKPIATEELLTTGEVAAMLSVDARTVTRWMNTGILPGIRLPSGHRRIRRTVVDEFLQAGAIRVE